ncbi:MAG: DinB family protein [Planctomycetaceae bacterium]|nr:DinB family protein [Planctomycetaceae bacterium]MCA9042861.1 DinB family protein [Planctomycetaceae bacterium]MCB9950235.1 DinB family protein [Planctomycetaceae bacterium]
MQVPQQIAKHLRDVHFGGNWTAVNLRELLADVTWPQATRRVGSFHTIAELVYHMNYFVSATLQVLEGGPLDAKESLSFDHPEISSQADWEQLLNKSWTDAEQLADAIERMPESQLWDDFIDAKYGNYYRCLNGPIEHCHYHLGQIALLKTLLADT